MNGTKIFFKWSAVGFKSNCLAKKVAGSAMCFISSSSYQFFNFFLSLSFSFLLEEEKHIRHISLCQYLSQWRDGENKKHTLRLTSDLFSVTGFANFRHLGMMWKSLAFLKGLI